MTSTEDFKADMERVESRLAESQKRVALLEKIAWGVAAVGVVFGVSGAFGYRAISKARAEIAQLGANTEQMRKDYDQIAQNKKAEFEKMLDELASEHDLKCRSLTIIDESGKPRLSLRTLDGSGHMALYNAAGKKTAELFVGETKQNGGLRIYDAAGLKYFDVGAEKDGALRAIFAKPHSDSNDMVRISFNDDGGRLQIFTSKHKRVVRLGATAEGDGELLVEGMSFGIPD